MRYLLTGILICSLLGGFAQKSDQKNALFTIRGNIGIPVPITSKSFRTSFAGLYEANLSFNLRLGGNFFLGVGYQNTLLQNNKFLKQQLYVSSTNNTAVPYTTNLMGNGIFLKFGYDKFFTERKGYYTFALNAGYMLCNYSDVNADTSAPNKPFQPQHFNTGYVQPEVSANWIVEDNLSFSLMFSYTTLLSHFDAREPRFNQFAEIRNVGNAYLMSWFTIGAGFNVLINGKKKAGKQ